MTRRNKWSVRYPLKPTPAACAAAYQLAGELLMVPEGLTEGQKTRMATLLLDFLSEPGRFTGKTLWRAHLEAKLP